jgi:DNA-binding NarL/FixJ family response regulator
VITVLVRASTAIARAGLETVVARRGTVQAMSGPPGASLAQQVDDLQLDVLLIDLGHERIASALRDLARSPRAPAIVVLTDQPRGMLADAGRRSGVRAVLPRDATAEEVIAAIEAAAAGLVVLHPDSADALQAVASSGGRARSSAQPLTPRETEVLAMMAEGLGNKIIAARLGISEHTVKFHIASIFAKLGAGSRTEAVTVGVRTGLIMI